MGRFGGSLTIVKGWVANWQEEEGNWQGEEGDPIQLNQGRPDTIERIGVVN
ncbi:hypothetical protein [Coleofasciculus chthonoplastes]|uniref:hypothetical protein n=1 Tax=Coleofasciculus chthonoplastes TaxID=64178 RepID=UPI0032FFF636